MRELHELQTSLIVLVLLWTPINTEGISKDGDVVLGALLTVRYKTSEDTCGRLKPQGLAYVEAMIHAIETINKDTKLLPNTTIGYDIRDSCDSPALANKYAFEFVTRNMELELLYSSSSNISRITRQIESGRLQQPIVTVIGAGDSGSSVVVASMLQIGSIPQISPFATSEELSLPYFKTFYRPVPPDGQQAKAIADVIDYFNWDYVSVIGVDTSYGRYGVISLENESQERGTFCIADISFFPSTGYQKKITALVSKIKLADNVKAIVLWGDPTTSLSFIKEARTQGVYGKTWLAPEGWSEATPIFKDKYMPIIGGFVGTKLRNFNLSGFEDHMKGLSYQTARVRNHTWWRDYWVLEEKCSSQSTCDLTNFHITDRLYNEMYTAYLAYVIDAVYAAAHAIDAVIRCPQHRSDCPSTSPFVTPKDVLQALPNVTFHGITGDVEFNNNGDSIRSAAYDYVNLHPGSQGPELKILGNWNRGVSPRQWINDSAVYWNNGSKKVPVSICNRPCGPGYFQTRTIMCCWRCIKCPAGLFSQSYGSPNCSTCPREQMPDTTQSKCVHLPELNIKFGDSQTIAIIVAGGLGALLVFFVIILGIKYRGTPVVKSSNRELSLLFLIGIIIGFVAGVLEIMRPSEIMCLILNPMHGAYYTLCLSILFVKTNRLVNVFKVKLVNSRFGGKLCSGSQSQYFLLLFLNAISVLILVLWHILDPPFVQVTIEPLRFIHLGCKDHRYVAGLVLQGLLYAYEITLSVLCAYYAFKARKLPANFSEARFIAFAMYMQLLCSICYATLQNSIEGNFLSTFSAAIIILSAYGYLICMFAPKVYVIFKYPERNTAEYVKAMVSNHTMRGNFNRLTVGQKSGNTNWSRIRTSTVLSTISQDSLATNDEASQRMRSLKRQKQTVHFTDNETDDAGSRQPRARASTANGVISRQNTNGRADTSRKAGNQINDIELSTIPDEPEHADKELTNHSIETNHVGKGLTNHSIETNHADKELTNHSIETNHVGGGLTNESLEPNHVDRGFTNEGFEPTHLERGSTNEGLDFFETKF